MTTARLHRLLDEQRAWLMGQELDALRQLDALLVAGREELLERMKAALAGLGEEAFTTQLMRATLEQTNAALAQIRAAIEGDLEGRLMGMGAAGAESIWAQVRLMDNAPALPLRLDLAQRLQGRSRLRLPEVMARWGALTVGAVEREMGIMLLARTPAWQAPDRLLAVAEDALLGSRARAALVYRNEMTGVYDLAAAEENERLGSALAARGSEPLLHRMDEAIDRKNHPFSRAAHGTLAAMGHPWKVSAAEVAIKAAEMKVRASGLLWAQVDGEWQGNSYPAHHNDRGRRTAWRQTWGDPKETAHGAG